MAMDVRVLDAEGLPEQSLLAIRVGDVRQQMPFKPGGMAFSFDPKRLPWLFGVDVLEKVGSTQVWLSDLAPVGVDADSAHLGCKAGCREMHGSVEVPRQDGDSIRLRTHVSITDGPDMWLESPPDGLGLQDDIHSSITPFLGPAKDVACSARNYLERHNVQNLLRSMVRAMLDMQPQDPLSFMIRFLTDQATRDSQLAAGSPNVVPAAAPAEPAAQPSMIDTRSSVDLSKIPGLGVEDTPGFPCDECPADLPEMQKHHSILASLFRKDPAMYQKLRELKTHGGVSLARCIKPGIDNCGHAMIKCGGAYAGDQECYELFREVFDPILQALLPGFQPQSEARPPKDMDMAKVCSEPLDPLGQRVVSVRARLGRNLAGLPFTTAMTPANRREAEHRLASALLNLGGDFEGCYFPLQGSTTYLGRPCGMTAVEQNKLSAATVLFTAPTASMVLSSGAGRDWPQARGVFWAQQSGLAAWVNSEEDHLRLIVFGQGSDLHGAVSRLCQVESILSDALSGTGGFSYSPRLGFLSAFPENVGTGLRVEVIMRLPLLGKEKNFRSRCKALGVGATREPDVAADVWSIYNAPRWGVAEAEQVGIVVDAARALIEDEHRLERNMPLAER